MEAFLLTALPLFSAGYITIKRTEERLSAYFSGLVISALLFIVRFFVFFCEQPHSASFIKNFVGLYMFHTLLPVLLCSALYFFFARFFKKGASQERSEQFFLLMLGFYTIFLPYNVFGENKIFSAFDLFALPLLFISLFFALRTLLKKVSVITIALSLLFSLIPALCETIAYYSPFIACVLSAVFALLSLASLFYSLRFQH